MEPILFAPATPCVAPTDMSCQSSSKPDIQIAILCSLIRWISLSINAMDCLTLFRKSRCACVKLEDIGHRPLNRYGRPIVPYYLMKEIHTLAELLEPLNRPNPEKSPR